MWLPLRRCQHVLDRQLCACSMIRAAARLLAHCGMLMPCVCWRAVCCRRRAMRSQPCKHPSSAMEATPPAGVQPLACVGVLAASGQPMRQTCARAATDSSGALSLPLRPAHRCPLCSFKTTGTCDSPCGGDQTVRKFCGGSCSRSIFSLTGQPLPVPAPAPQRSAPPAKGAAATPPAARGLPTAASGGECGNKLGICAAGECCGEYGEPVSMLPSAANQLCCASALLSKALCGGMHVSSSSLHHGDAFPLSSGRCCCCLQAFVARQLIAATPTASRSTRERGHAARQTPLHRRLPATPSLAEPRQATPLLPRPLPTTPLISPHLRRPPSRQSGRPQRLPLRLPRLR
jgi:hypothetical protein